MKNEIKIEHVSKNLDGKTVLNDINLVLESNKIYGFIGRNGSGKSTLFKTICGFIRPDRGNVLVNGEDIYKNNSFPKNTRALIEIPEFLSDLSGYDNLKLLADINHCISDQEIINTLDLVNLLFEKDKKFKKYSFGMKQKLGIAQVIMENPDILIFDEPFNGVDEKSVEQISHYLKKIKNQNKIILIASHVKEDIENLCDVTFKMVDGQVEQNKES